MRKFLLIFGVILVLIGIACMVAAGIWQQVLCYEKFGVLFNELFIPHPSAFLYVGIVPMIIGCFFIYMDL